MKINGKKVMLGAVAVMAAGALVFTSVMAAKEQTKENDSEKPGVFRVNKEGKGKFCGKGGFGFFKNDKMNKKKLTDEQKAELEERFADKKELTEEEKTALKEKMEERKAEMDAKMQEKEAERQEKLKEKLDNGEITQEQYDKMIKKTPGHGFKGKGHGKGMGRGFGHKFGKGTDNCPAEECPETEITE